jgi:hypothetical protein
MSEKSEELVARMVRAFFAPVDRATGTPTTFDPAMAFDLESPPSPWLAAGEIRDLKRAAGTRFGSLASGTKGAVTAQFRAGLDARVSFEFCEWGKLQMAIAGGSQHMNVLAEAANASGAPSGGAAVAAIAVLSGSSANELVLGTGAVDLFTAGDMVAVDIDYAQETGYVGSPITAAFVKHAADVMRDRDYLRRVTFNVARVQEQTATSLIIERPLAGGIPPQGASVQKVIAFVDREGGSFFQEWSALFVLESECGGRVCFYYPRLQAAGTASETTTKVDSFAMQRLRAEMIALPVKDTLDAEQAVCWRSWMPVVTT